MDGAFHQVPFLPVVVKPTRGDAASVLAARQRSVIAGLGAEQLKALAIKRQGTWKAVNKECEYLGARVYDKPCTAENIANYILVESSYNTARRKLQLALTMHPKTGPARWQWMQAVMGWVSIAHFATSFPAQFLYGAKEVESPDRKRSVFAFGPPEAQQVLGEMLAAVGGKDLFLPIPIKEFFRFEDPHGLSPPWEAQEKGLTRRDQELLERRRGQKRRARRRRERDRPFLPTAKKAWLVRAGGSTTRTPPSLVMILGMDVPRGTAINVPRYHGRVPSPELLMDYVRAWARSIASRPFSDILVDANIRYLDYYGGFPAKLANMSPQELRDLKRQMANAKGQAVIGITTSAATTVGAFTGIGLLGGLAIALGGAIASRILKKFAGMLQGCPRFPRPPNLRTLGETECDVTGGAGTKSLIEGLNTMAARFEAGDPNAAEEGPPDDLPIEDEEEGSVLGKVVVGGLALGGILLVIRQLRP